MSCGVGGRHGSDLLWLWRRLIAIALIRPLAWEPTYDIGVAPKRQKNKNKKIQLAQKTYKMSLKHPIEQGNAKKKNFFFNDGMVQEPTERTPNGQNWKKYSL